MSKIVIRIGLLLSVVLLSAVLASAQQPPQPAEGPMPQEQPRPAMAPHPPMDPLGGLMFPPEMIMQHQRELGLTDEQKTFMRREIKRLHMELAIRIKNRLTPEQQEKLHAGMHMMMGPGPDGPGRGPGRGPGGPSPAPGQAPRPEGQPRPDEPPIP